MPKFSGPTAPAPNTFAPVTTTGRTLTHEGGAGWSRDAKSDLFLLAVTNMVGEHTFYESAPERDERFRQLIAQVVAEDPEWVARLVPYLRDTMQMRSASVVMAAEYVRAGGPNGRRVVDSACSRADEPAELLGYWMSRYGRKLPQPLKRGLADACKRLYTERALLRYDGQSRGMRFADVIELTHPKPDTEWQGELFRHAIDRRHNRALDTERIGHLGAVACDAWLLGLPQDERRDFLAKMRSGDTVAVEVWEKAGWSWERLSGWLPGGMDSEAWEAVIPQMGYMALLRNLRNFDKAGISGDTARGVASRLADPEEVARSRQFPMRFLSAWKAVQGMRWAQPLEDAVQHSLANVPELPGSTLVMVDVSGSMTSPLSNRSELQRWEAAAVFGSALALRNPGAQLAPYSTQVLGVHTAEPGASILRLVEGIGRLVGGGTYTMQCIRSAYQGHDRVIVLTDEQAHDAGYVELGDIPRIYTFNLGGYSPSHLPSGQQGRFTFGGLTDAGFRVLPLLERGSDASWPF